MSGGILNIRLLAVAVCGAVAALGAARSSSAPASDPPPAWAFPVNPPAKSSPTGPQNPNKLEHVTGSPVTYTDRQLYDEFFTADWFPAEHPPMPRIVARGNPHACATADIPGIMLVTGGRSSQMRSANGAKGKSSISSCIRSSYAELASATVIFLPSCQAAEDIRRPRPAPALEHKARAPSTTFSAQMPSGPVATSAATSTDESTTTLTACQCRDTSGSARKQSRAR